MDDGRLTAILDELDAGREVQCLGVYDLTDWRRKLPAGVGPVTLGERIRARRLELGLSQEHLGRRFRVGRMTVQRWEKDERVPAPRHRRVLSSVLKVKKS